jgi:predicted MFS family arabinose efflux permease
MYVREFITRGILCCPPNLPFFFIHAKNVPGANTVIFSGSMAFGAPAVGYFTDFFGPQETLILGGVAVVVVSVVVILSTLKQRKAS